MKDRDGAEIRLRDRIRVSNGDIGTVVASFDSAEFTDEYPQDAWNDQETGILVKTDKGALVRFDDTHQKLLTRIGE